MAVTATAPEAETEAEATTEPERTAEVAWGWYSSEAYGACMHERLGLTRAQVGLINNEMPGGGVMASVAATGPGAASRRQSPLSLPLPDVLVLDESKAVALDVFLSRHGFELLESVFHSHLDDTKRFLVFARPPQHGA